MYSLIYMTTVFLVKDLKMKTPKVLFVTGKMYCIYAWSFSSYTTILLFNFIWHMHALYNTGGLQRKEELMMLNSMKSRSSCVPPPTWPYTTAPVLRTAVRILRWTQTILRKTLETWPSRVKYWSRPLSRSPHLLQMWTNWPISRYVCYYSAIIAF